MSRPLEGKVAIVTGSSKGIGYEIIKRLASEGAKVVVTSRNAEECHAVAKEFNAAGAEAIAIPCDIVKPDQLDNLFDKTLEAYGTVDILVNNVGGGTPCHILEDTREHFRWTFDVNVEAMYFATQRAAQIMVAQKKRGKIIQIASTACYFATRSMGLYSASKAAVVSFARSMALELGPYGINVNAIAPGTTISNNEDRSEEVMNGFREVTPMARLSEARDIANTVFFLSSEQSNAIAGVTLPVDGGYSAVKILRSQPPVVAMYDM